MRGRRSEVGLSLIELLVALVLTALIMAGLPTAVRLANRALGTVAIIDREDAALAALDVVSRHLTQATALYERGPDGRLQVLFHGEAGAVSFVAPATLGPIGGVFRFWLTTQPVGGGLVGNGTSDPTRDVVFGWQLYRPPAAENVPRPERRERVLVANATRFSLRYFGAPQTGAEPEWTTEWPAGDTIPDLVEVQLAMRRPGGEHAQTIRVTLRLKPPR